MANKIAICKFCGKEFLSQSWGKRGNSKFCSRKCFTDSRKSGKDVVCEHCGKSFYVEHALLEEGKGKFCSKECFYAHPSPLKGRSFGGFVDKVCETCGMTFKARRSKSNRRFCSDKCAHVKFVGENAPNWRGGRVVGVEAIRLSINNRLWRQEVFKRDKFVCQDCGDDTGGNLHAHHLKSFSKLIDEVQKYMPLINIELAALQYPPLWDISNGVTLCEKCHTERHKIINSNKRLFKDLTN